MVGWKIKNLQMCPYYSVVQIPPVILFREPLILAPVLPRSKGVNIFNPLWKGIILFDSGEGYSF